MAAEDIDRYLAELTEPARGTLEQLRRDVLTVVPRAEQCISYSAPAFKVDGRTVAGFAAFKNHLSYLPHSGSRPASTRCKPAASIQAGAEVDRDPIA
jgi:uncharacterized protein YdhG (YjbR/CyaY superfamily)